MSTIRTADGPWRETGFLILAGGHSRRFGEPKAFFQFEGRNLIEHVVHPLNGASEVVISCKTGEGELANLFPRARVVRDREAVKGPMAGLLGALPLIRSEYVVVLPCDIPRLRPEVIGLLVERGRGRSAAVPRWPAGHIEPLTAVYHTREMEEAVQQAWDDGEMKLSRAIDRLSDVVYVPTEEIGEVDPELDSFTNINLPSDLKGITDGSSPSRGRR
ncbi:MAG: molybdenum cofactor guanylyltransferase [Methanomassiliicoccales archaeon]